MSDAAPRLPLLLPSHHPFDDKPGPRQDFLLLAQSLGDAPLLYPPPRPNTLERRTASDLRQAVAAFRRRRSVGAYVSFSERVGLPLALLLGRHSPVPHVLVAHHLTSDRKRCLHAATGVLGRFTRIVVLCREQERYLTETIGLPPRRVRFLYDKIDTQFWNGGGDAAPDAPLLAVGSERRDFALLLDAARHLTDHRFVIVANSPWSRRANLPSGVPPNVRVEARLSAAELRERYREAALVVVPLLPGTRHAAGVNAVLEAMAMHKPLVVSRTPGIEDYVKEGARDLCRAVPPGDLDALCAALCAAAPGCSGHLDRVRAVTASRSGIDTYVAVLAGIVRDAMAEAGTR